MSSAHYRERHSVDATQLISYQRLGIAADVLVAFVTRRRRKQNQRGVRIANDDVSVLSNDSPSGCNHARTRLKLQRSFDAGRFAILAAQDECASRRSRKAGVRVCLRFDGRLLRRRKTGAKTNLVGTICSEADDNHLIHRTDEDFASEMHADRSVRDSGNGRIEIQFAPIGRDCIVARKFKFQISDRLIRHLLNWIGHHLCPSQLVRFFVFAGEDQPPRFRQCFERFTIIRIVWPTRIKRIFIQL